MKKAKKLRLLVTKQCPRDCAGCCNKQFDLDALPVQRIDESLAQYDEIIITGGEPLLFTSTIFHLVLQIKKLSKAKIYLYTACAEQWREWDLFLNWIDGITVSLHEQTDANDFYFAEMMLYAYRKGQAYDGKTLRLNVFHAIGYHKPMFKWDIKDDIEWLDPCPVPEGEEFKRTARLLEW